jgi:membrane protein insertase Oxa1/YidC/SpoIIIJ
MQAFAKSQSSSIQQLNTAVTRPSLLHSSLTTHVPRGSLLKSLNSPRAFQHVSNGKWVAAAAPIASVDTSTVPNVDPALDTAVNTSNGLFDMTIDEIERFLCVVHEASGLPWWASLAICAVSFRTLVVPFSILRLRATSALFRFGPHLTQIITAVKRMLNMPKDVVSRPILKFEAVPVAMKMFNLRAKKNGVSIWGILSPMLVAIPCFVAFNTAVRRMFKQSHGSVAPAEGTSAAMTTASSPSTESWMDLWRNIDTQSLALKLQSEGPFFCPDLTIPDDSGVFPALALALTSANIYLAFHSLEDLRAQVAGETPVQGLKEGKIKRILMPILQTSVVLIIPLGMNVPAYTFLYWDVVMGYSIIQTWLFKSQWLRDRCGFSKPAFPLQPTPLDYVSQGTSPLVYHLPNLPQKTLQVVKKINEIQIATENDQFTRVQAMLQDLMAGHQPRVADEDREILDFFVEQIKNGANFEQAKVMWAEMQRNKSIA